MPVENPLACQPAHPFHVIRSAQAPVHFDISVTNRAYQELLRNTVWQYYKLVLTQWPLQPGNQALPVHATQTGEIFNTFPGRAPELPPSPLSPISRWKPSIKPVRNWGA